MRDDSISQFAHIGPTIRKLRQNHHITGEELGRRAGLSQSKISKIETNKYSTLSIKEINKILNILNTSETIRQQIESVLRTTQAHAIHPYRSYSHSEEAVLGRERRATTTQTFVYSLPHVLLQTAPYREAVIKSRQTSDEAFAKRMHITLRRQELLWQKDKHFHFILHESALYSTVADAQTRIAQLYMLENLLGLKHVTIGILPVQAGLPPVEHSAFVIYDKKQAILTLAHVELSTEEAADVAEYLRLFEELAERALYGDAARELIRKADFYFS